MSTTFAEDGGWNDKNAPKNNIDAHNDPVGFGNPSPDMGFNRAGSDYESAGGVGIEGTSPPLDSDLEGIHESNDRFSDDTHSGDDKGEPEKEEGLFDKAKEKFNKFTKGL